MAQNDLSAFFRRFGRYLILLPPLFLFIMMQKSALVYPFYDHLELVRFFESFYAGTLSWVDLFAPHNHTRPAVYRAVMLGNGVITDWDIRSEYVYLYGSIFLTFAFHYLTLRKLNLSAFSLTIFGILFSILCFSPVAHNNHWWSMMFQLTFTNAMIAFALTFSGIDPVNKKNQYLAIVAIGLGLFTLTNTIVALIAIGALHLFMDFQAKKLTFPSLIWVTCGVALLALYFLLPGSLETSSSSAFDFKKFISFFFVYLGAPLGLLFKFEYVNQFHIPTTTGITLLNGLIGLILSAAALYFMWKTKNQLKTSPQARMLFLFTLFALGSAFLTAYGRSNFDDYGLYNANASRYTLFSSYLIFGLLYFFTDSNFRQRWLRIFSKNRWVPAILFIGFLGVSAHTYQKSKRVYRASAIFNTVLNRAYYSTNTPETLKSIYPDPDAAQSFVNSLKDLGIGPYRHQYNNHVASPTAN